MKVVTTYLVKENVMKILLPIVLFSLILISCQSKSEQKSEILKYQIASKQDKSFMNNTRMVYKIMLDVDSLPKDVEMLNTAGSLWENGNKNWKEFSILVYLPGMNTESIEYGTGNFNKDGLLSFFKNEGALLGTRWETKKIEVPIKETRVSNLKEYKIDLSATDAGENKVIINVKTNFPDGTNMSLSIYRIFYTKGDTTSYIGELGDEDFSVINGNFEMSLIINDTEWYNKRQRLIKDLPNDFSPIAKISNKITIDVLYTPAVPQPANVLEVLGTRGEFVTGEGSEHFGTGTLGRLTLFRVSKKLSFPMEGRVKKSPEYTNYQSLKVNATYAISKETPLMPEFEPSDPLAAMNNVKYLQSGSRIRILSIKTKYNSPWYEVQAKSKTGEGIGKGWINSTALIGQDILVITGIKE
jgi:hypothetical protein